MDSKRDFERKKLKDLELVLSNKEKENDALKEQINKTKSDSQSDLETEHLKCVEINRQMEIQGEELSTALKGHKISRNKIDILN